MGRAIAPARRAAQGRGHLQTPVEPPRWRLPERPPEKVGATPRQYGQRWPGSGEIP